MATPNPCLIIEPQPHQDVAAKSLDESHAFTCSCRKIRADRAVWNSRENLFQQRDRLFHFANPDPDAGVDVALLENRYSEVELVIGRIGKRPARIKGAPRCA